MATKKKQAGKRSAGGIPGLDMNEISKLTLMDVYSEDDSGGEDDLEAELQAIMSGKGPAPRTERKKREPMNLNVIQKMVDECMVSDDSDGGNEDLSGDEDLMAELNEVVEKSPTRHAAPPVVPQHTKPSSETNRSPAKGGTLNTLKERLSSYSEAELAAKSIGDTSKARRYGRAMKTLETLIRECSAGREVNVDDIPPPVVAKAQPQSPAESDVPPKTDIVKEVTPPRPQMERQISNRRISMKEAKVESTNAMLTSRRDQYKMAALNAKKSGDVATAMKYVKISKQFDLVIEALANGQPIDLSKMPPPLPREVVSAVPTRAAPSAPHPAAPDPPRPAAPDPPGPAALDCPVPSPPKKAHSEVTLDTFEENEEEAKKFFNAPAAPSTVLEALVQRLEKYQSTQKAAASENNSSKAKRLGRIIKQYEDAIKCYKAGKPVDFESLPAPPGFGEIPGVSAVVPPAPPPAAKPVQVVRPVARPAEPPTTPALTPQPSLKPSGRSPSSLLDKQLNFLSERHRLFREAALEAKKNGDMEQAKEYLRMAKGIEPMIEATKSGLPIDATSIPTPPQLKEDFMVVDKSECLEDDWGGDKQEMFRTLERDLSKQIDICGKNRAHFLSLGDVPSADKFAKLCLHTKQDLNVIQNLWKKGEALPKFHYETRVFSMVQCHSELTDNEVEVTVVRGINLPGKPKELDSYCKIEFPYPSETPQHNRTHTIKDTIAPEYNASFKFEINRKSRSLVRVLKRHNLKLEVWSKGGFLRSDALLGTAQVKLSDLETKCTIHDSFDLLNGRKACGGKLEVKVCVRDPLLAKQVEEVKERWLIVGS